MPNLYIEKQLVIARNHSSTNNTIFHFDLECARVHACLRNTPNGLMNCVKTTHPDNRATGRRHSLSLCHILSKKAWVTVWLSYCSLPGIKCSYNSTEFRFKEVSSVSTCNSCYVPSIVFFFFSKVIILGGNKCWWIELNWKALDTFGNCQRPVFSWCIPTCIITNLWTFWLNCSSKLQEKKNIIVAQICVLSHYTHNKRLQAWSLLI